MVRRETLGKRRKLSIAIPASIVSDVPHLREKTSKVGLIGRTAAIFRVDEIIIYPDNIEVNQHEDMHLVATLLSYMETPQYLRRKLFGLKRELRYVGILPPLRTPHHPLNRKVKIGEYREGVTISKTKLGTLVDVGVEKPVLIRRKLSLGKRVTVKILKVAELVEGEIANREEIVEYWGYRVREEKKSIGKLLKSKRFNLKIATSKHGVPFTNIRKKMAEKWNRSATVLIVFGAPTRGLYEILEDEGLKLEELVDFVVNTIPMQGTETVRTEEALLASLAIFNSILGIIG
ncbi:RNA-binding protein [Candidatus Bathyarchaeota archaeon]|nr:MAG: RNA-binding protein [Candidatus Bathyarchaeota archaeon]